MRMKIAVSFCLVVISFGVLAQSDSSANVLSFEDAVKIALEKNVDLNTQKNAEERANALMLQSTAQMLPSISASSDLYARKGRQQIQNPETNQVEFVDVVSNNFSGSLNTSLPLFGGLNRIQTFRASLSTLRSQKYGTERSRQTTVFTVAQQYLQVLLSLQLYRIAKDNFRNQTENLRQIQEKVQLGALSPVDEYNQMAEVKRLESVAIRSLNTYETDKLVLAQTLQLEPGYEFKLENPGFSVQQSASLTVDLDELYAAALESRPDFKQQKFSVQSNRLTVKALRGSYFPSVTAFYNYGSSYNSQVPFDRNDQLVKINPYHFYGFTFNIPIFNGLNSHTRVQTAKVDLKNSELQYQNLKNTIYREVKTAYLNFEAAKASYISAINQFNAATEAYSLGKQRYDLGASSFFEFSQANNALILAQAAKAQAEFTLMFQETILDYQVGKLKF